MFTGVGITLRAVELVVVSILKRYSNVRTRHGREFFQMLTCEWGSKLKIFFKGGFFYRLSSNEKHKRNKQWLNSVCLHCSHFRLTSILSTTQLRRQWVTWALIVMYGCGRTMKLFFLICILYLIFIPFISLILSCFTAVACKFPVLCNKKTSQAVFGIA